MKVMINGNGRNKPPQGLGSDFFIAPISRDPFLHLGMVSVVCVVLKECA